MAEYFEAKYVTSTRNETLLRYAIPIEFQAESQLCLASASNLSMYLLGKFFIQKAKSRNNNWPSKLWPVKKM